MAVRPNNEMLKRSAVLLAFIVFIGFGIGIVSLIKIQLINNEQYQQKAELQQLSDKPLSAGRGLIYDRNMKVLAQSATAWKIYIMPGKIKKESIRSLISKELPKIIETLDYDSLYEIVCKQSNYEVVARKVDISVKNAVSDFISDNDLGSYMGIDEDSKRYYPYNSFASKIIGFTGNDDQGLGGLEKAFDDVLTGIPGRIVTAKNAKQIEMPVQFETTIDAQQGKSLVLTIDEVIQYYLEKNLEQACIDNIANSATGIVMEVKTGAILAMSTKPDYDPNDPFQVQNEEMQTLLASLTGEEKEKQTSAALNEQWRNNAISDTYEPGSVFKMVTAAAAIEEGVVTEETHFYCPGYINVADRRINCHKTTGHGAETFAEGLQNSCNPVFVTVAQKMGVKTFYDYVKGFGFTEKTGIELVGETSSIFHDVNKMGISELSSSSFGQTFQVTPIQMITAVNAIANGGKLMEPYIVQEVIDENGNTVSETKPTVKRQVVSEDTARRVSLMLEDVVTVGTGKNAYVAGYRVAGKTGTSEKVGKYNADGSKKYIASFCAFAPADDPEVVILVLIDEPKGWSHSGGTIVGPVVGAVMEKTLDNLNIEPRYTEDELKNLDITTPNLVNASLNSAQTDLQGLGLEIRVVGNGDKVYKQMPLAGQSIPKGGTVVVYTDENSEQKLTTVPDLKGMTISQANKVIVNAGLNIKITGKSLEDSEAVVYSQDIEKDTAVEMGTVITVNFRQMLEEGYESVHDATASE